MPLQSTRFCKSCSRTLPIEAFDVSYHANGHKRGVQQRCSECRAKAARVVVPTVPPNPSGLCMCGCGQKTRTSPQSHTERGWAKGHPVQHVPGHNQAIRKNEVDVVPETGCWNWKGTIDGLGYGSFNRNGRHISAHRYYYERINGEIPAGLSLDHLCRNRRCVNPDHLEPVTHAENVRRGASAHITANTAGRIKAMLESLSPAEVARRLNVSPHIVESISRGKSWRDVLPNHQNDPAPPSRP